MPRTDRTTVRLTRGQIGEETAGKREESYGQHSGPKRRFRQPLTAAVSAETHINPARLAMTGALSAA